MKDDKTTEDCVNELKEVWRELMLALAEGFGIYKFLDWLESKLSKIKRG